MFVFPSLKRAIEGKLEHCTSNKLAFLEKGSLHWTEVEGDSEAYAEVLKAWWNIQVGKDCSVYGSLYKWVEGGPDLLSSIKVGDACRLDLSDAYRDVYCQLGNCCKLTIEGPFIEDMKAPLCVQGRDFCNVKIVNKYGSTFSSILKETAFIGNSFDLELVDNAASITIDMKAKEGNIYVYHNGAFIFELPEGEQTRALVFDYLDKKSFKNYKFIKEVNDVSSIPRPVPA